jgi:Ca2+-binding RTX toxin-like protein
MKRLAVLSLLAPLAVLGTSTSAQAAALCQGQEPTIVGTPGETVVGTAGDDVIVSEGADEVEAGDGNDLICVTGEDDPNRIWVTVFAGPGDDIVDTTAFDWDVIAELGPGVDAFVGGPGPDEVRTRDTGSMGETIATGGGRDRVIMGWWGRPVNDVVDLGPGLDYLKLRGLPGTGSLDAGAGRDLVQVTDRSRAEWRIDNRKRSLSVGDVTMPMLGVESFDLGDLRWGSVRFVGGPDDETLDLWKYPPAKPDGGVTVDMGGGDDRFIPGPAPLSGPYHGGAGRDWLSIEAVRANMRKGSVSADLVAGLVRVGADHEVKATSWSDLTLEGFGRNSVRTGPGSQYVVVRGCRATVHAGAGDDVVRHHPSAFPCGGAVAARAFTAYGEGGDDILTGGTGDDRLMGGPGRDTAKGGPGRDVCSAEVRIGCERGA